MANPVIPNLVFNVLTFDFPKENPTFYFSNEDNGKCQKIHKSIFPKDIKTLFPNAGVNGSEFVYTTFTGKTEGFKPLSINFKTENPDFLKRYYDRQINFYFRVIKEQIVKVGFIKENQVWIHSQSQSTSQWNVYEKYSLKAQISSVSKFPEIHLSYDGISKVLKKSVADLIQDISPTCFNWIFYENQLQKWERITEEDVPDYTKYFPVLNKELQAALNIPAEAPPKDNRYPKYLQKVTAFYSTFINTKEFKELLPLHDGGFLGVAPTRINTTKNESNLLLFGTDTSPVPKYGIRDYKPFKASPYQNIHLFYIFHKDDVEHAKKINKYFNEGFLWFKGLYKYAKVLFHTEKNFSIEFTDKCNPIPEIEKILSERDIKPDIKYIAIYLTPYSKYDHDKQKREIYYKVKELLLKREVMIL